MHSLPASLGLADCEYGTQDEHNQDRNDFHVRALLMFEVRIVHRPA
jgi:hypothetical protein